MCWSGRESPVILPAGVSRTLRAGFTVHGRFVGSLSDHPSAQALSHCCLSRRDEGRARPHARQGCSAAGMVGNMASRARRRGCRVMPFDGFLIQPRAGTVSIQTTTSCRRHQALTGTNKNLGDVMNRAAAGDDHPRRGAAARRSCPPARARFAATGRTPVDEPHRGQVKRPEAWRRSGAPSTTPMSG